VNLDSLIELVVLAFGGGIAWGTLRGRLKTIDDQIKKLRETDLTNLEDRLLRTKELAHLEKRLDGLPCQGKEDCPDSLA
jgi:hypothetical protein